MVPQGLSHLLRVLATFSETSIASFLRSKSILASTNILQKRCSSNHRRKGCFAVHFFVVQVLALVYRLLLLLSLLGIFPAVSTKVLSSSTSIFRIGEQKYQVHVPVLDIFPTERRSLAIVHSLFRVGLAWCPVDCSKYQVFFFEGSGTCHVEALDPVSLPPSSCCSPLFCSTSLRSS